MLIQSGLSKQIIEFHPLDGDMGSLRGGGVTLDGGKKFFSIELGSEWYE